MVSGPSTTTLIKEPLIENSKQVLRKCINKEHLALKLNHLKEKAARYEPQKDFISRCIKNYLTRTGLELELEPTIGNFGQEFIENCFSKLKYYCDKTVAQTKLATQNIEAKLKASMARERFSEIDKKNQGK